MGLGFLIGDMCITMIHFLPYFPFHNVKLGLAALHGVHVPYFSQTHFCSFL